TGIELFSDRGYDNVTIDEVVTAAGVSTRTFYRYYDAKEDLVIAAHQREFDHLLAALHERPAEERLLDALHHDVAQVHATDEFAGDDALRRQRIQLLGTPALRIRLAGMYLQF